MFTGWEGDGRGITTGRASFCLSTGDVWKGGKVISVPRERILHG